MDEPQNATVSYEEWVRRVERDCYGHYHDERTFEEIEEELLVALRPVRAGDPTGFVGRPAFVSDPIQHAPDVSRLVQALFWSAWMRDPYPFATPRNARLYDDFDHADTVWMIGVADDATTDITDATSTIDVTATAVIADKNAPDGTSHRSGPQRRLVFEERLDLQALPCETTAELRLLHAAIAAAVGPPL